MNKEYTYASIGNKCFCMQSSILSTGWILLFKYRAMHLESLGIQRRQIPGILKTLVKYRLLGQTSSTHFLTLPVFGHLCIKVHQGHKVFNLSKLTTTKVFSEGVSSTDAGDEIKSITEAGTLNFTPTVLAVESGNRWYTETFIAGSRSKRTGQSNPEQLFKTTVVHHLREMMLLRPVRSTGIGSYAHMLQKSLDKHLEHTHLDSELQGNLQAFVEMIGIKLAPFNNMAVSLAYTHGDFSFVNFVYREDQIWVIDWEDAGERSLFHDLFNYFFTEVYYERTHNTLDTAISEAIDLLMERHDSGQVAESYSASDNKAAYRLLYYLERMIMLLSRDASANRSRVIQRTIDLFTTN